jgi:hypothetical protein
VVKMKKRAKKRVKKEVRIPKLASLPSVALVQAVGDLIKVERDNKKVVVMSEWVTLIPAKEDDRSDEIAQAMKKQHKPKAACAVCFAGAVMVGVNQPRNMTTSVFPEPLQTRLDALDEFRQGNVYAALTQWGYNCEFIETHAPPDFSAPDYEDQPGKFKTAMRKLAKDLDKAGF